MGKRLTKQERDKKIEQKMSHSQLCQLAYQTCCWWNSVFVQEKRFFDLYYCNDPNEADPWNAEITKGIFITEREFLIISICNAVRLLERLNKEIQYDGDTSLEPVIAAISRVAPIADIRNLRNMNVHRLDYMMGGGFAQENFRAHTMVGSFSVETDATITFGYGNEILLGNVPIHELLPVMKEQFSVVKSKTNEVHIKSLIASSSNKA